MIHVLVTGSNGQLGSELQSLQSQLPNFQFTFTDTDRLNITDAHQINQFLKTDKYDFLINCAAYTAVDKAEEEKEMAMFINATAVGYLANACQKEGVKLIHISTDFVFDGKNSQPYTENDTVSPINEYGNTKALGEIEALKHGGIVIRTSWLYSTYGHNFLKTMIRLGEERSNLSVVYDQIGTPTYARDLAISLIAIMQHNQVQEINEVFHFSNEGVASWYDFAKAIFSHNKLNCALQPIISAQYPTPAARPHFSVLNKAKIKQTFDIDIPHWQDSLKQCLDKLNNHE